MAWLILIQHCKLEFKATTGPIEYVRYKMKEFGGENNLHIFIKLTEMKSKAKSNFDF